MSKIPPLRPFDAQGVDGRIWARKLQAQHSDPRGVPLTLFQIECYRRALGLDEKAAA